MEKSTKPKIVFMGTSHFAAVILRRLATAEYEISDVYTRPDKKAGRDQEAKRSAVKIAAEDLNLSTREPEKLDENVAHEIESIRPDIILVAAYGKILPAAVLKIPRYGCVNVHASLLPKFRGPSPIQNAILNGDGTTGTTIMLMDEGIDTGDILAQQKLNIDPDETCPQLSARLAELSSRLLLETLPAWLEGKIKPQKQENSQASICQLIERRDGQINWSDDARSIYNLYRAFMPWPGVYSFWEKNGVYVRLKLLKINISDGNNSDYHIGEVFSLDGKIGVKTGLGTIILEELQMEGKNKMTAEEFLRGAPDFVGDKLK